MTAVAGASASHRCLEVVATSAFLADAAGQPGTCKKINGYQVNGKIIF